MLRQVVEAYISGLEALVARREVDWRGASCRSFFVSDRHGSGSSLVTLAGGDDGVGDPAFWRCVARPRVAQAQVAINISCRILGPRWQALSAHGARVQRPWASTSTKNPAYSIFCT